MIVRGNGYNLERTSTYILPGPTGFIQALIRFMVRNTVSARLAPSGRQIDVAVHWYQPLAIGELRLGAVATHQPGHRATAGPELTLLSGWRWIF